MEHTRAKGIPRAYRTRFDEFTGKIYCGACHKVVNARIETAHARELLIDMFQGSARLLDLNDQRVLAAWGAKTAYAVWGRMQKPRGVPISHRRYLLEHSAPHPNVFVSYSRCTGERIRVIFARTEIIPRSGAPKSWAYDCVVAIGQMAIKIWGPQARVPQLEYKALTSFATQVSPPRDDVARWPPGRLLDDDGVTELWDFDPRANRISIEL
jgi:hypothetical protein